MLRRLAAVARTHLLWIGLLAIASSATYFWLHLEDYLGLELHGAALMPEMDTRPAATSAAAPCTGTAPDTTAAPPATAAGPAR